MAKSISINEIHDLIASDKVDGTAIYDMSGDRLGTINNFMVDKRCSRSTSRGAYLPSSLVRSQPLLRY